MSSRPLSRSPDLQRLLADGYALEVRSNCLLVHDVPYVKSDRKIGFGILVTTLNLAGDRTVQPDNHVAFWEGEFPCDAEGRLMDSLGTPNSGHRVDEGLTAHHTFSRKPQPSGLYSDYHQKVTTYVAIITGEAQRVDDSVSAQRRKAVRLPPETSVFEYSETWSAKAGIAPINSKLDCGRMAIIGLGGTGSYVLDLVAKTPVREIHLFDADILLTHNAFRSPGAPTLDELERSPKKVDWFTSIYSKMRRGIVAHANPIDSSTVTDLESMNFVFLCMDAGADKRSAVEFLLSKKIPFIDVGIGLVSGGESLSGSVRVTRATGDHADLARATIPVSDAGPDEYDKNIQVADLNALNAVLAVIRWKKDCGFYADFGGEHSMVYQVVTNTIVNEEVAVEGQKPAP